MLDGNCTFNVLVYADADSEVPLEWGDSDAKEVKNAEKVMLRSFSTNSHKIDTMVSYRYVVSFADLRVPLRLCWQDGLGLRIRIGFLVSRGHGVLRRLGRFCVLPYENC